MSQVALQYLELSGQIDDPLKRIQDLCKRLPPDHMRIPSDEIRELLTNAVKRRVARLIERVLSNAEINNRILMLRESNSKDAPDFPVVAKIWAQECVAFMEDIGPDLWEVVCDAHAVA